MDIRIKNAIKKIGGETIHFDVPMSQYTTIRAGGNAEAVYKAMNLEDLRKMVSFLVDEKIPYLPVGKGSNLLVLDGGMDGVVILLGGSFAFIVEDPVNGDDTKRVEPGLLAGAAISLPRLIAYCTKKGLAGAEFLAGIPGTVGGAIAMNAGSMSGEIKDVVCEVSVLNRKLTIERGDISRLKFQYRGLDLNTGDIILNARLNLRSDKPSSVKERVFYNIKQRKKRFPFEIPSAGSVFKNPDGDYAGRLIDLAGLKGKSIGGATISTDHANIIVTKDKVSASDIVELINLTADKVKELFNITLLPEIKIVGKPH